MTNTLISLAQIRLLKLFPCFLLFAFFSNTLFAQTKTLLLGRPTDKSVTASILFDKKVDFFLEFGTQKGTYTNKTAIITNSINNPNEVDMEGLKPNTRYYYRMQYRLSGAAVYTSSPEYSFMTQRSLGSSFNFAVEADEHLYDKKGVRSIYKLTLQNQLKQQPDFMLSLGDIFGDDHTPNSTTSKDMDDLHKDYLQFLGEACHSMPFFVCLGNHEGESGYYLKQTPPNNIGVYGTLWRKFYYPNPIPNTFYSGNINKEPYGMDLPANYYAWTWGDATFIVLDVYRHCDINEKPQNWDWTLGKAQYDWFKKTLENSKSKYKFVFSHHTRGQGRGGIATAKGFEWGGIGSKGTDEFQTNRPGWDLPIHQLMVKNKVTIFFQGHDHLYAQEQLDGLVYQEVPMPSDSTYQIGALANAEAYTDITLDGTGHLNVSVAPEGVKVDFVRAFLPADTKDGKHTNGEIAYSYTVTSDGKISKGANLGNIFSYSNNGGENGGTAGGNGGGNVVLANELEQTDEFVKIFPNPTDNKIKLEFSENVGAFRVRLMNFIGQTISQSQTTELDVTNVASGTYFLRVETDKKRVLRKIVINH
jgi:hypothetical protein